MADRPECIGDKIRHYRLEKGLTQKQLAEKCGMYESQIRKYETGKANPKIGTLRRIADGLGVKLYEIADWTQYSAEDFIEDFSMVQTEDGLIRVFPKEQAQQKFDNELLSMVHKLDEPYQEKVMTYAQDLAKIPEYQKKTTK